MAANGALSRNPKAIAPDAARLAIRQKLTLHIALQCLVIPGKAFTMLTIPRADGAILIADTTTVRVALAS
jgi:hypothetical protein